MPLHRQLPKKRGFVSRRPPVSVVSLRQIVNKFEAKETVNPRILAQKGLVKSALMPIKIVGDGDLKKELIFEKVLVSGPVRAKIEKAGGKILT